jgi:hypothetical protein
MMNRKKDYAMSGAKTIEVLGKVIDLLRAEGVKIDDPYDFENFMDENARHFQLFKTKRFKLGGLGDAEATHEEQDPERFDGLR